MNYQISQGCVAIIGNAGDCYYAYHVLS